MQLATGSVAEAMACGFAAILMSCLLSTNPLIYFVQHSCTLMSADLQGSWLFLNLKIPYVSYIESPAVAMPIFISPHCYPILIRNKILIFFYIQHFMKAMISNSMVYEFKIS